eukprot:1131994-Prymnesium_polylepis.1
MLTVSPASLPRTPPHPESGVRPCSALPATGITCIGHACSVRYHLHPRQPSPFDNSNDLRYMHRGSSVSSRSYCVYIM